jgi:hypothetical protein
MEEYDIYDLSLVNGGREFTETEKDNIANGSLGVADRIRIANILPPQRNVFDVRQTTLTPARQMPPQIPLAPAPQIPPQRPPPPVRANNLQDIEQKRTLMTNKRSIPKRKASERY